MLPAAVGRPLVSFTDTGLTFGDNQRRAAGICIVLQKPVVMAAGK